MSEPYVCKGKKYTPLLGNGQESTICVLKLYSGDFIWL